MSFAHRVHLSVSNKQVGLSGIEPILTVIFRAGECELFEEEVALLKKWVCTWVDGPGHPNLFLGGAFDTSRTGRLRRLACLTRQFEKLGIPKKRIHADEDWLKPSRMGSVDDLPSDMVWLQVRDLSGRK